MPLTDIQLTTEADIIKNETSLGANTANRVGVMLEDIIANKINNDKIATSTALGNSDTVVPSQNAVKNYVDAKTKYKVYTILLSQTGGTVTAIQLQNTIGNGTSDGVNDIAWTNPSNGILLGTMTTGNPFTVDKTWGISDSVGGSGGPYTVLFASPSLTTVRLALFKDNGTQPGTPTITNLSIEIRVYP